MGCAKTAEPIEMQIGCRLVRANTTNSVLGGSLITPREKAWEVILGHDQNCRLSIFSTLLARGQR